MNTAELARRIRVHAIDMTNAAHASHIAPILSIADIVSVLYGSVMTVHPDQPRHPDRDRFVLSKGHAGVAVYSALAECGFFPVKDLDNYYLDGSYLSGHISHKNVPGVEVSTGSLGHGVCMACGMAFAAKKDGKRHHVYALVGDGECEEGSVWEMALFASHNRLNNLTVIVDHNKYQALGTCEEVLGLDNLAMKWASFGFAVHECDGHDHNELTKVLSSSSIDRPQCVIAHTVKGKGVSFMENNLLWHYRDPQGDFYDKAKGELSEAKHA